MHFSAKKFFLIGFIVILLVGIPLTVYFLQQQQEVRQRAAPATTFSFVPDSSSSNPISKTVGDTIPLDINVDPGTNLVSFIKLEITYDPDKLATASGNAFQPNTTAFPTTLDGPIYSPGKIAVVLSVGTDPTKAIKAAVKAATINLKALKETGANTPTLVQYTSVAQAFSVGSTDQASENVLSSTKPATIVILASANPTQPPAPTAAVPTAGPTSVNNSAPVCTSLAADVTSGASPLAVKFTVSGTDSDGTISKATFNFGDGQVSDVTTGGGITTNSVNAELSHTYSSSGTFQATAILTDNGSGVSNTTNCSQTITVNGGGSNGGGGTTVIATATPTLAPTGSTEVIMGIGAVATFLMIGGGLLFFLL